MIRLAEPALDLMLAAGERLSKAVERDDLEWTTPRAVSPSGPPRRVGPGRTATTTTGRA